MICSKKMMFYDFRFLINIDILKKVSRRSYRFSAHSLMFKQDEEEI